MNISQSKNYYTIFPKTSSIRKHKIIYQRPLIEMPKQLGRTPQQLIRFFIFSCELTEMYLLGPISFRPKIIYILWLSSQRKYNLSMLTNKIAFLMLLSLSYLVLADQFQARILQTTQCCSTCSQKLNNYFAASPTKFKNQVMNATISGLSDTSGLLKLLKGLHFDFTDQLYQEMQNFDSMIQLGAAACPVDVTGTGQVPYSQFPDQIINWLQTVLNQETQYSFLIQSPNFVRQFNNLTSMTNQYLQSNLSLQNQLKPILQMFKSYRAMGTAYTMNQQNKEDFVAMGEDPEDICVQTVRKDNLCFEYQNYSSNGFIKFAEQQTLTVTSNEVTQISFLRNLDPNLATQQVNVTNLSFNKFTTDDLISIFSPDFLSIYQNVYFSGSIYVPDGLNLSTLPNNGFGPGETVSTIWAKLTAMIYTPYLYCGMSGFYDNLKLTCPASCNQAC